MWTGSGGTHFKPIKLFLTMLPETSSPQPHSLLSSLSCVYFTPPLWALSVTL